MNIGSRLREIRKDKNLSQIYVAQRANIAVNSIRLYESGKRQPRMDQLQKIASALDVPVWELIGETSPVLVAQKVVQQKISDATAPIRKIRKSALDAAYNALNEQGQIKALERVEELGKIPDYQKPKTSK